MNYLTQFCLCFVVVFVVRRYSRIKRLCGRLLGWIQRKWEKNQEPESLVLGVDGATESQRDTVLRKFKCPLEEEEICPFRSTPERCPFSHIGPQAMELLLTQPKVTRYGGLKEVPAFVCIQNLTNSCLRMRSTTSTTVNSLNSLYSPHSNAKNILYYCVDGLHLSLEQMDKLMYFRAKNQLTIRRFYGGDANLGCGVCYARVLLKESTNLFRENNQRFGILENCSHCFCAECIMALRRRREYACPECETISTRVAYRRRFTDKIEEKRGIFAEQRKLYPKILN